VRATHTSRLIVRSESARAKSDWTDMTQAYLKGSTGRKNTEEGRESDTGGAHGGPQDEGPCRCLRDDHNKAETKCKGDTQAGGFPHRHLLLQARADARRAAESEGHQLPKESSTLASSSPSHRVATKSVVTLKPAVMNVSLAPSTNASTQKVHHDARNVSLVPVHPASVMNVLGQTTAARAAVHAMAVGRQLQQAQVAKVGKTLAHALHPQEVAEDQTVPRTWAKEPTIKHCCELTASSLSSPLRSSPPSTAGTTDSDNWKGVSPLWLV